MLDISYDALNISARVRVLGGLGGGGRSRYPVPKVEAMAAGLRASGTPWGKHGGKRVYSANRCAGSKG